MHHQNTKILKITFLNSFQFFQMTALSGLPLRASMDVHKWMEDKFQKISSPLIRDLCIKMFDFCKDHPFIGACVILTAITSLGPLLLFLGFLLFTNICLLLGVAFVEFLIITAGLSVFIPIFLAGTVFSVAMTSGFAVLTKLLLGNKQKKNKKKCYDSTAPSEALKGLVGNPPMKTEELQNKMMQTTDLIGKKGQTEMGTTEMGMTEMGTAEMGTTEMGTTGQIEEMSISKLMDEELTNGDGYIKN